MRDVQNDNILKALLRFQSLYYLTTALWPIFHIESFMFITGYKQDVWLVKTVGALLIPVAATLASYSFAKSLDRPALILGIGTCISFIGVDFYYSLSKIISRIYMLDGFLQMALLGVWCFIIFRRKSNAVLKDAG